MLVLIHQAPYCCTKHNGNDAHQNYQGSLKVGNFFNS